MSVPLADSMKVFAGRASATFTERLCAEIGIPVGKARVDSFPDGELIVKLDEDVRGRDCFVVQSTSTPVNEYLMELLIWIDCLKRASAERITAVIPYFGYARQDRKSEGRTPITAKLVANLITAAGADRVIAMDLHAAQVQGFFDIPMDHLLASPVLSNYFVKELPSLTADCNGLAIVSPDPGNLKAASFYAEKLNADLAFIDKRRKSATSVAMTNIVGEIEGKTVLMFDDMITTGGTITEASKILKEHGARRILVTATHGVFAGQAVERIARSPIEKLIITDTIPTCDRLEPIRDRITVLSVAPLMGEAIKRIHLNQSVSAVLKGAQGGKR
ncbi:MAG TPA: ribose-phosphate pyrophosphokinase [Phycisphaerae bacterium]|nr:ribose-phosphate pyrophosphokinase [Phycisphaerae bacterium]